MSIKKGNKWALSCVSVSAAILVGISVNNINVNADVEDTDSTVTGVAVSQSVSENSGSGKLSTDSGADASTSQNVGSTNNSTSQNGDESSKNALGASKSVSGDSQKASSTTNSNVANVNPDVKDGGHVSDDYPDVANNTLGYASKFHVFANDATLTAHTNGNIAVKNLHGEVNFGTNIHETLVNKDISYIQNMTKIAGSSFVEAPDDETRGNKVIFGDSIKLDVTNPHRPTADGTYIDHLKAGEIHQDKNGNKYIDFDTYFKILKATSDSLSNENPDVHIKSSDFTDPNQRVINLQGYEPNEKNEIIINIDPDVLRSGTPLTIYGLSKDAGGTNVIFNVDTNGIEEYDINSQIRLIYNNGQTNDGNDTSERPNKETEYFDDNHLLWNFYNNNGLINIDRPFQGSVLAPNSTINVNQNLDGNIIANKVNVRAESHRWDFQDNSDKKTQFERPVVIPGQVPELPGEEDNDGNNIEHPDEEEEEEIDEDGNLIDPEDPDSEKPGTTDPDTDNGDEDGDEDTDNGTDEDKDDEDTDNGTDEDKDDEDTDNGTDEDKDDDKDDEDTDNGTDEDKDDEDADTDTDEDKDDEESDANTDENQNLITNGGSEGSQETSDSKDNELEGGVLSDVVGNDKTESQTPDLATSNTTGTLPQTGEASGVIATIAGIIMIALGFLLKTIGIKKD